MGSAPTLGTPQQAVQWSRAKRPPVADCVWYGTRVCSGTCVRFRTWAGVLLALQAGDPGSSGGSRDAYVRLHEKTLWSFRNECYFDSN